MKIFIRTAKGRTVEIDAKPVHIGGLSLAIHKSFNDTGYTITEPTTGMFIGIGATENICKEMASQRIAQVGIETINKWIVEYTKEPKQ